MGGKGLITKRAAVLHLESWAGRITVRVTVIGETPKRYRVRFEEEAGAFNWVRPKGCVGMVPKYAIVFVEGA